MSCYGAFDVRDDGLRAFGFAAVGLPFILFGLVFLRMHLRRGYVFLGVGVLTIVMTAINVGREYWPMRQAMNSGNCPFVDGVVENFRPGIMEANQKRRESFDVAGHHFEYIGYDNTPAFTRTQAQGGPIAAGQHVRIWYRNGEILRLETCWP